MPASSTSGLKVLLMTDLVGSVSLQQRLGLDAYTRLKEQHDALVEAVVKKAPTGRILEHTGDGFFIVFDNVKDAIEAALTLQYRIHHGDWLQERPKVRIGIHLGEVTPTIDHATGVPRYAGINVSLTARIMDCAAGAQILLSRPVYENGQSTVRVHPIEPPAPPPTLRWKAHGRFALKGIDEQMELYEVGGDGIAALATPPGDLSAGGVFSSFRPAWLKAGAVIAILAVGAVFFARPFTAPKTSEDAAATTAETPPVDAKPTIAVLPFSNFDGNENASFVAGVHEDILTSLARLSQLQVISRTSVLAYEDSRKNLREIGAELGASHLVEGSVRRAGNRVRVTVQLIEAATDQHLWAETFDRELQDVFAIQSEISTQIATNLLEKLSPAEAAELEEAPTTNIAAYDAYNRARALWRNRETGENVLPEIAAQLQEAIALDPSFAAAGNLLTEIYEDWAADPANADQVPREAARFALGQVKRFAPALSRVMAARFEAGDPDAADAALAEATRELREGAVADAAEQLEKAAALDAGNRERRFLVVSRLTTLGHHTKAIAQLENWLERSPEDAGAQLALHLARTTLDPSDANRTALRREVEGSARGTLATRDIYPLASLLADPALGLALFEELRETSQNSATSESEIDAGLLFFALWAGETNRARAAAARILGAPATETPAPRQRLAIFFSRRVLDESIEPTAVAEAFEARLANDGDPFRRVAAFPLLVALWSTAEVDRAAALFRSLPPAANGSDLLPGLLLHAPFMSAIFENTEIQATLAARPEWAAIVAAIRAAYQPLP